MENWKQLQKKIKKEDAKKLKSALKKIAKEIKSGDKNKSKSKPDKNSKEREKSKSSKKDSEAKRSKKISKNEDKEHKDKSKKRKGSNLDQGKNGKENNSADISSASKESKKEKSKKKRSLGDSDELIYNGIETSNRSSKKRKVEAEANTEPKKSREDTSGKRDTEAIEASRSDTNSDTDSDSYSNFDAVAQTVAQAEGETDPEKKTKQSVDQEMFLKVIQDKKNSPGTPQEWFVALAKAEKYVRLNRIRQKFAQKGELSDQQVVPQDRVALSELDNLDKLDLEKHLVPVEKQNMIGKFLAVDCEMVGCGPKGVRSALARVSIVNFYGVVVMDKYCKPQEKVTDYRTWVSGIRPADLKNAESFDKVRAEVLELFRDKIVVGHAISNDFKALKIRHPPELVRDTSKYMPFRNHVNNSTPGLKKLSLIELNLKIQDGEHSSVIDAQITMLLYRKVRAHWDLLVKKKHRVKAKRAERGVSRNIKVKK